MKITISSSNKTVTYVLAEVLRAWFLQVSFFASFCSCSNNYLQLKNSTALQ